MPQNKDWRQPFNFAKCITGELHTFFMTWPGTLKPGKLRGFTRNKNQ